MGNFFERYIWLHALILVLGLAFIFRNKNNGQPTRLNLRNKMQKALVKHHKHKRSAKYDDYLGAINLEFEQAKTQMQNANDFRVKKERDLSCVFMFNGHCYEAYESLGLPAGSSYDKVLNTYQELSRDTDLSKREFLLAALQAIESQQKRRA